MDAVPGKLPAPTPAQRRLLREALAVLFDYGALRQLLFDEWGVRYEQIVPHAANLNDALDELLNFTVAAGQPHALLQAGLARRPERPLQNAAERLPLAYRTTPVDCRALVEAAQTHRALRGAAPEPDWDAALRPYLEWLQRRTARLAFGALDPAGKESDNISLGDVFINLHAGELEVPWPEEPGRRGVIAQAIGQLAARRQLVLIGDAGSGKSSLLNYLAYRLCSHLLDPQAQHLAHLQWEVVERTEESRPQHPGESFPERPRRPGEAERATLHRQWQEPCLPLLIELRNFVQQPFDPADGRAFWEYYKRYLAEDVFDQAQRSALELLLGALYRRAVAGDVIWLFDGIDETPPEQREAVWQAVRALEKGAFAKCRWAATSRKLSFDAELLPRRGIAVQTLQPLSPEQIAQFVATWFAALQRVGELTAGEAALKARLLTDAVAARDEDFRKMAANPMLLTIMALVQTYGVLPEQRARLYQACVETLLLRWQRRKESRSDAPLPTALAALGVEYRTLERLLWEIGWKAHEGAKSREEAADIGKAEVLAVAEKHLGSLTRAAQFIEYTEQRAHILVGRGGRAENIYTFPHRTLQEYLAACHLTKQRDRNRNRLMRRLAAQPDLWREVLNLAIGYLVFVVNDVEAAVDAVAAVAPDTAPDTAPGTDDVAGWRRVWMAGELGAVIGREAMLRDDAGALLWPQVQAQLTALVAHGRLSPLQRAAAADALAQLGDTRPGVGVDPRTGLPDIAWGGEVPAGQYQLQKDARAFRSLETRTAAIRYPYRLARYPVTYVQFQCFLKATDRDDARWWAGMPERDKDWRDNEYPVREFADQAFPVANRPRERVSWYQAVAFCRWLEYHLRAAGAIGADQQVLLPHEDEWEVAARYAGAGRVDARAYPWGDADITPEHANYSDTGIGQTTAVGLFPAGRQPHLDLDDLSGNVWEWCRNKDDNPADDGVDKSGARRTLRGGSWDSFSSSSARASYRGSNLPAYRDYGIGFRVVCVVRPPSHQPPAGRGPLSRPAQR